MIRALWRRRVSLRWRLAAWYVATLVATLGVVAVGSLVELARVLDERQDRFLVEASRAYLSELLVEVEEMNSVAMAAETTVRDLRFGGTWVFVFIGEGRVLARSNPNDGKTRVLPVGMLDSLRQLSRVVSARTLRAIGDGRERIRVVLRPAPVGRERIVVVVAQSEADTQEMIRAVSIGYAVIVAAIVLCASFGAYAMARRALAPMAELAAATRQIDAATLHQRTASTGALDEVGELAGVINDLAARLDRAFATQHQFVADASHELRTPAAIVLAEADVALSSETYGAKEYRESLTVIRDAGRRLGRVVDELLLLAQIDAGHIPVCSTFAHLEEIISDGIRAVRALAQARGVTIVDEPSPKAPFHGDINLLAALVLNLLDNAIKYSPPGGRVWVRIVHGATAYQLIVSDEGPGIPAAERERIFERFSRLEATRTRPDGSLTGGAGLGLAIARWVAEAHGGTLECRASTHGLTGAEFVAVLPRRHVPLSPSARFPNGTAIETLPASG